MKLSFRYES